MGEGSSCRVYAVVSIDSRGQIVLPKEVREKMGLKPDDRVAVIGCESEKDSCCIVMMNADKLNETVRTVLGPMLKEIIE